MALAFIFECNILYTFTTDTIFKAGRQNVESGFHHKEGNNNRSDFETHGKFKIADGHKILGADHPQRQCITIFFNRQDLIFLDFVDWN